MAYEPGRGDSISPSDTTVAFTAKLNISDSYPSHSGVLKFANVLINEGGGYSPGTDTTVAFTAKLNISDSYPCHSGVLKFADVLINEGGGYSPGTGLFTCPVDGLYHFTVNVSVYGLGQCAIFKNGEKVVSLYHTSLPDKCSQVASMSSVIKLSTRDEVWVNLWGPGRNDIFATDDNDTVFTGFRLG